jgi:putative transposase
MSRAVSPVSGKPYGLAAVCRAWRLARSGVYRHQSPPPDVPPRRRGPLGVMSDQALTMEIRAVLAASPFHGEDHRKVWARLRFGGTRTSLRRVLRLMRENDMLAPGRVGSPRGPRSHEGTIIPETVDTVWGTDLTFTFTREGPAASGAARIRDTYNATWLIERHGFISPAKFRQDQLHTVKQAA